MYPNSELLINNSGPVNQNKPIGLSDSTWNISVVIENSFHLFGNDLKIRHTIIYLFLDGVRKRPYFL